MESGGNLFRLFCQSGRYQYQLLGEQRDCVFALAQTGNAEVNNLIERSRRHGDTEKKYGRSTGFRKRYQRVGIGYDYPFTARLDPSLFLPATKGAAYGVQGGTGIIG